MPNVMIFFKMRNDKKKKKQLFFIFLSGLSRLFIYIHISHIMVSVYTRFIFWYYYSEDH